MLVIRMQRTGRKGHAQFRVVVQDSRRTPTSGKIVAALGHFNPHTKETSLDKEKAAFYLENGAQPSERVVRLLQAEGVKLPKWVADEAKKQGKLRNPDKLRRNRPAEESNPEAEAPQGTEAAAGEAETPADSSDEQATADDAAKEQSAADETDVSADTEIAAAENSPETAAADDTPEAAADEGQPETEAPAEAAASDKPGEGSDTEDSEAKNKA